MGQNKNMMPDGKIYDMNEVNKNVDVVNSLVSDIQKNLNQNYER